VGVAGTSGYGGVYEARFNFPASVTSSANPKPTCTNDTDGDGKLNHNDLDSDGDGCPDAVESGTTAISTSGVSSSAKLTTSIIPGLYGANGFANGLETSSESGLYTGTYTYKYAINANINACKDTDGDNISDFLDIDDDNDGILDITEQINCIPYGIDLNTISLSGSSVTATTANSYTTAGGDAWKSSYSDQNLKLPISLKFKNNSTTGYSMFGLIPAASAQTPASWNDGAYKFYPQTTILYGYFTSQWDPNGIALATTDVLGIDISATGYVTVTVNGVSKKAYQGTVSDYKLVVSSYRASTLTDIILSDASNPLQYNCTDIDTDNDGVPNRLDLDSDGDGCPDAVEAGVTNNTGSGVASNAKLTTSIISAPYGNNGFANGLETATESTIYSGTYNYNFATDVNVSACRDTDADGVPDVLDIDDDNDGVLDDLEEETCRSNFNFSAIGTTAQDINLGGGLFVTQVSSAATATGSDNAGNLALTSGATATLNFSSPVILKIKHANNTAVTFDNGDRWNISSSGTIFTLKDPSSNLTLNSNAVGAINFTPKSVTVNNDAEDWLITTNKLSSITFKLEAGNPFSDLRMDIDCGYDIDTDGDGTPNRLDLDSDGDGCPDAVESGTTYISTSGIGASAKLTASVIPGSYGTNGFANGLETTTDSGIYTGTYTYLYAITSTGNACLDTDSDGVADIYDLDDDNDGVLDLVECPLTNILVNGDFTGSTTGWTANANWVWKTGDFIWNSADNVSNNLISQTFGKPIFDAEAITEDIAFDFGTNGTGWAITSTGTATMDVLINNTVYATLSNPSGGTTASVVAKNGATVNVSSVNIITTNVPSSRIIITVPKNIFTNSNTIGFNFSATVDDIGIDNVFIGTKINSCDTDGDGVVNGKDSDSDGDGCPDAVEAGTTYIATSGVPSSAKLTTSVIPAPYGANGFANGLETSSESGAYTGTYSYNFAIDAAQSACKDSDGDGVPDVLDLDDDNDGVLDSVECPMVQLNSNETNGTFGTAAAPRNLSNTSVTGGYIYSASNTGASQYAVINQGTPYHTSSAFWRYPGHTTGAADDAYLAVNGNTTVGYFYNENLNLQNGVKYRISFWHQAASALNDYSLAAELVAANGITILATASTGAQNSLGWKLATIDYVSTSNQSATFRIKNLSTNASGNDFSIDDISLTPLNCPDTDGDGIPNSLDLDSDGDGCPDAKESGVNSVLTSGSVQNGSGGVVTSTNTVANAIAAGPYGANGLANGVETATESGVVSYTSTYATNALVADLTAPVVATQPLNKTVFVGSPVILTAAAGTPPSNRTLTYQWYKAGVAITGATSASYTVTSSATTANAADYYCALGFVNSCLTTNTNTVNVTVLTNPVGLTACQDANAVLTVTKTGTNTITYQWKKGATNLVNGTNIAGATTATLALSNLTLSDAGVYTLVATDGYGNTINSVAGTITITNNTKYTVASSTTICATTNTVNLAGGVVSGTSGATSTKWQRSLDGGATWVDVTSNLDAGITYTNITTGTLGITASSLSASATLNGYQYRIATANATCTNYSNVETINIGSAPVITAQPSNSVLCNSISTSFTASATGIGLTYQWQTRPSGNGAWTSITAANAATIDAGVIYSNYATATLNLSAAPATENNNQYQVVFTNSCGTVTSTTAILNPTVVTPTLTGANVSVCSGTPVTLTATSSTASSTYQWYLGGVAIGGATAASYNPTASGNYSVIAAATGYCSSATASGTVTINPLPTVTIAEGAVLSLGAGSGIQLTASALPTGTYSYIWYKDGTAISGQTTNVLNVTSIGSYTVKATNNSTSCAATSAATIISSLPAPSVNGSSTICTGGSVGISISVGAGQIIQWESSTNGTAWTPINGANSASYTAAPINNTNGQILVYYHAVITAGTNVSDPVGTSNAIAVTVNPLPTATIATSNSAAVCAGTAITLTATTNATNPVYTWFNNGNIIVGANASTYSTTSSGVYNFSVSDGNTSCAAGSATSTVNIVSPPAAPNLTATSAIICVNTFADLTLYQPQAVTGVTYEWHTVSSNPTSGDLVVNPNAVSTAGTYYLYAKNNSAGCYSTASVAFTLTVNSVANATLTSASNQTYLVGDFATALTAATTNPTYVLRWYASATGGVVLTSPVLSSTSMAGITNYYVEQYNPVSYCASASRVQAIVTVKPLTPTVSNVVYCQNATASSLNATAAIGGTLNWYSTSTGGSASSIATIPSTSSVGTTNYYVSQTVNGVESDRALITVTVNQATATPSVVSGNTTVVSLTTETYSVTNITNTTYQWTLPSFMSGSATSNSITATINGAGTGYVSVIATDASGCPSAASRTSVQVQSTAYVAPTPTTSNATYTVGDPSNPANTSGLISGANGSTINYYSNPAGSSSSNQTIPNNPGTYTFYASQTINGVESALVPYTIIIKPLQPIVADITYCQNDVAVALNATGNSLKWYTVSTGGSFTTSAPTPSTGTATNTTYYVSQTIGGVESDRIALLVTINPTPSTPSSIAGATTVLASTSEIYSVINDVTVTSYNWTLPSGWSGASTTNSINATVGTSGGQIILTASNGACTSPASTLTIAIAGVTNPPATSNVTFVTGSVPSNIATNTSALITPDAGATLNYYTSNAAGTASTTSQSTPTTSGVYTYYVSQTIVTGGLAVESILVPYTVTVKPIAPAINTNTGIVGNAIVYCKNSLASILTATTSAGGTLKWYTVATGGTGATSAPTPSTSIVGVTNYYVSQTVNGVESDRSLITVTVNDLPGTVNATANTQPTCSITSGSILVASPLGTGFTYSIDGTNYTNTTFFTTLPPGTYNVTAQNSNGCISSPTSVIINPALLAPLAPITSQVQPTCANQNGSITVQVVNNTDSYSINGGLSYQSNNIFTNVPTGAYSVTVKNVSGCISLGTNAIINAAPPIPAQPNISSSANGSVCVGTSITLSSTASTGNQWYKDGVLIAGAVNNTFVPLVAGNYTVIVTNATGCSSPASPAYNVTFNPIPVPAITEGATLAFNNCSTTTITLSATNSVTANGNTYQWYLNGNSINVNGNNATYNATQAGNYSVAITNNGCTSTSPISKVIAAPSLNAANTSICAGGNAAITISGLNTGFTNPTYQWQISTDGGTTFTNATGAGINSLTYTATAAGKYQLVVTDWGVTSTSCPIAVTQFATPNITIISPASPYATCAGNSVVLSAVANSGTASYTYQWFNSGNIIANATSATYTTTIAGNYGIQVTDANGCQANAAPTTIAVLALPAAPTVVVTNPTCSVTTGTISVTAPLGTGYTYSIDGINYTNTTGLFTGVASGNYSVTVKSPQGCIGLASNATVAAALVVPAAPVFVSPELNVAANSLNTYTVTPVSGASSYTWIVPSNWTGVSNTNSITIKVDVSNGPLSVVANSATCSSAPTSINLVVSNTTADIAVTDINVPVSGNLATNDLVPAGTSYGQPANNPTNPSGGNITVNSNGTYTFTGTTPGKYVYYIPVCAPGQTTNCPLTPLEITVLAPIPPTDKPVVNNDQSTTASGTPVTVNILANDAAGNPGGTLNTSSVTITTAPKHGTVIVNNNGSIIYTPAPGFIGSDSVTYNVCDNSSPIPLCQNAVVYFTVTAPTAPSATVAVDDYATVSASANGTNSVSGNLLNNDSNTAGGTLTATVVAGPTAAQGVFTLNANGAYTFTPAPGFSGPVNIVYQACTPAGVCELATLHILVDPAPVIAPDFTATSLNVPVNGSLATNDVVPTGTTYGQPGNNPSNPSGGTIVVNPDGSYTFTGTTPGKYVYYVPVCAPDQTTGCPLVPLEITVVDPLAANNKPIANNDIAITNANTATTLNVLANDKASNVATALDPASLSVTIQPTHGTVVVNNNGSITYTPANNFVGTDSITYSVCDNASPAICQTAVVYFTVKPSTASPTTTAVDDFATIVASTLGTPTIAVAGNVLTNDKNTASASLTASLVNGPTAAQGVFTMNANGSYTFTPTAGFSGTVDIVYTACTGSTPPVCSTATLHILVEPAPVIVPDITATDINVPVSGNLATNDKVPTGTTYGQPADNPNNPSGGTIVVNPDGSYTFTGTTPGKYVYYVPVCAPGQTTACPLSPLEITVLDPNTVNDVPLLSNDIATTIAATPVTVNVLANDKAGNIGAAINSSSELITIAPTHGTAVINSDGTITYTPAAGFVGKDSLTYSVCDNTSPTPLCNTAILYFTVNPVTTPATTTANDDVALILAGRNATGNVLSNDNNTAGNTLTASLVNGPSSAQGTIVFNANGSYTFTPSPGFSGPVDITYKACDGSTPAVCSIATLHILVEPNPITTTILTPDLNATNINVPVTGNLSTNDQLVPGSTYGQPAPNPSNPAGAVITVSPNGTYTFTGTIPGTYTYYVPVCTANQTTNCPLSPLQITVLNPLANSNAPVANTDIATLPSGTTTTVNVLANDKAGNVGATLNAASVSVAVQPAHGTVTVNVDGSINYTPTAGFVGTDSVIYNVCDNTAPTPICKNAVVYFTVTASNAPASTIAADDYATLAANANGTASITGNVLTNDKNTIGAALTATLVTGPTASQGTFTMNANGTYNFTPTTGFSGPIDITYTTCSNAGDCATATLHILVTPAPVLVNDVGSAFINIPKAGNISTNDVVPAGTAYGQPAQITGATITVGPNGIYTFTATTAGTYTYTIPVCAPGQTTNCPTETLVITVPVNTLVNDTASAFINIPKAGNISTNDVVPAGTTYGQPAQLTGATITVGPNGTYSFTATASGTYTYTVPVCAPGQSTNCPMETLVITVTDPTPPVMNKTIPDFGVTVISVPLSGNLNTNDNVSSGTSYGQPAANASNPTGATITVNTNGTYSFNATQPGTYTYYVPACPAGQTTGCPLSPLVITVVDPLSNTNAPIVNPDIATTIVNTPVTTNVLANDKAANLGTSLNQSSLSIASAPKHGTVIVNADGTLTYTPANGFVGTDSVTYSICDNSTPTPICKTGVVYYTVNAANASPVTIAGDDFTNTYGRNPVSGNVLSNDKNTSGATLVVTANSSVPASKGVFLMNTNGTFTFTPAPGFTGPVDVTYAVCGGTPQVCTNATLHLLVDPLIPAKILEVTKIANAVKMNLDGSFNISFVLKVQNLTKDFIDSVLLKDDLTKVFNDTRGITISSVDVSGTLIKNNRYDGVNNIDLLSIQSALDPGHLDSVVLKINVPSSISGNFANTAIASAPTNYGLITTNSTDPTRINSASDTTRMPTLFTIAAVDVIIPPSFSPNNDGFNDAWVIARPTGTTITVKVFNRWGNEIYSSSDYKNDWRGKGISNFLGEDVPEGTYYYVVEASDINNVTRRFAGSLTLVR
jgi:gliding motility-associated-like protein